MEKNQEISELISIIMPVYNSAEFLKGAVESVINQDYFCWELLLIDDGSTDTSGPICDRFAAGDHRIRTFHIPNAGVSHARNLGMSMSSGEYIVFFDSDDILSPSFLSTLKRQIEQYKADIIRCGAKIIYDNSTVYSPGIENYNWQVYDSPRKIHLPAQMYDVVWGKMFRRSLLAEHNILFDEFLNRGEDTLFIYEAVLCCGSILYSDNELLNYRLRDTSLMRRPPSPALYIQSVHKYHQLCKFTGQLQNGSPLMKHLCLDALIAITENLFDSASEKELFKNNFQAFCKDTALQNALAKYRRSFRRKICLSISIMLLLNYPVFNSINRSFLRLLARI